MKCLSNMERLHLPNDLVMQLFRLYEQKGQSYYYKALFSRDDEVMARTTLELDTQALAYYLKLNLTPARIKLLSDPKKDFVAKNKDEILLKNLKEILSRVQQLADTFDLTTNEIKDLTLTMFRGYDDIRLIRDPKAKAERLAKSFEELTPEDKLKKIIELFHQHRRNNKYEMVQIMTNFYIDFVKLGLFSDRNDLIGLMTIYTLAAKYFKVCRYDSFFQALLPLQPQFDSGFIQASYNWSEGFSQTEPIQRILVNVLETLHKNVEIKAHEYEFERKMNKTNSIEGTVLSGPATFSKKDIRVKHPYASDATINRTLMSLKERGLIRPLGSGRTAQWLRVTDKLEKFNPQQLDLFNHAE
ncbi:MAG: hypothetical protein RBS87_00935 [Acholeplasma sp.]|nr:hypothetical protein [Acholeplasma sp.]